MAAQHQVAALQDVRLAGLPLVEVLATAEPAAAVADRLAVIVSGDGGWASLDRAIASEFARRGIPVVGIDSLRYFWKVRTPEQTATDVAAVIAHYSSVWHRNRVDMVGYSFGADVLPFIANRLPAGDVARIATFTMVEPSESANFEIHVSNWLPGITTPGLPLAPEIARLRPSPLCLHGGGDAVTACKGLPTGRVEQIGEGHHLGGHGDRIVDRILQ